MGVDSRTEHRVYISSEFCGEVSSFIFFEGGTPSKSLGEKKIGCGLPRQEGRRGWP